METSHDSDQGKEEEEEQKLEGQEQTLTVPPEDPSIIAAMRARGPIEGEVFLWRRYAMPITPLDDGKTFMINNIHFNRGTLRPCSELRFQTTGYERAYGWELSHGRF